jgi:hypothetical protein
MDEKHDNNTLHLEAFAIPNGNHEIFLKVFEKNKNAMENFRK